MGLNIKLFVHGVPMGQKIWGPQGDDNRYLASFYGPKWEVPEVMIVETLSYGNNNYCYYSFVKGQNVFDFQGRAGAYFALTLRINAFYSDIQNVYNILKASYEKMCVGLCIDDTNDKAKFLLADFQNADSKFKEIENHILNYISEFSIDSDIVVLKGIAQSGGAVFNLNLHECSSNVAIDILKKKGKLMVSPWFLSSSASKKVAQYKEEMLRNAQKAQEEIQLQKQASQQKINEVILQSKENYESLKRQSDNELRQKQEQCYQQLSQLKNENDRKLDEIKNRYTKVDSELTNQQRIIKEQEKEISSLANLCKRKDQEIEQSNRTINNLVQQINSLQRGDNSHGRYENSLLRGKKIILGICSFFILLLIAFFTYWFIGQNKFKGQTNKLQKQKQQIGQLKITNDSLQKEISRLYNQNDSLILCSNPKRDSVNKTKIKNKDKGNKDNSK